MTDACVPQYYRQRLRRGNVTARAGALGASTGARVFPRRADTGTGDLDSVTPTTLNPTNVAGISGVSPRGHSVNWACTRPLCHAHALHLPC